MTLEDTIEYLTNVAGVTATQLFIRYDSTSNQWIVKVSAYLATGSTMYDALVEVIEIRKRATGK